MTRSTKLLSRKKPTKPVAGPSPYAPRLPRLDPDAYGALSDVERRRYNLLRDLEDILDAEPHATHELEALGWKTNLRPSETGHGGLDVEVDETGAEVAKLTPVEAAADRGVITQANRLTEWLAEAKEATSQITRTARYARHVGPRPLEAGTAVGGVVVGQRGDGTQTCVRCGQDITPDDPCKTIKGVGVFHLRASGDREACYWQEWRERRNAS